MLYGKPDLKLSTCQYDELYIRKHCEKFIGMVAMNIFWCIFIDKQFTYMCISVHMLGKSSIGEEAWQQVCLK